MAPTPEYVQSGYTYTLTNAKGGTVVDLSGLDNKSIIGYPYHSGTNQQWTLNLTSSGWIFKSVSSGLYLGIEGSPTNGTHLIATPTPVGWDIWHDTVDPSTYRVYLPGSHYNLDLANYGSPVPGTPVTLWFNWNGAHQTWKFQRV